MASSVDARFDLAAPFQRRLSRITLRCWKDNQRASILPPLFRGGYAAPQPPTPHLKKCFDLAAPFQRRLFDFPGGASVALGGFDLAAPFQRRLCCGKVAEGAVKVMLRSCRPFSEAVMSSHLPRPDSRYTLRSCRPFSEAVISPRCSSPWIPRWCFDLAAPFQRRLSSGPTLSTHGHSRFDLAAPFQRRLSGGENGNLSGDNGFDLAAPFQRRLLWPDMHRMKWRVMLRSCRPFSEAVIQFHRRGRVPAGAASILPPLFRGGYAPSRNNPAGPIALRSCRPFSEAVICCLVHIVALMDMLRSCRPFSEAVIWRTAPCNPVPAQCFDLAAPFQRRLSAFRHRQASMPHLASILPPLFRGGYAGGKAGKRSLAPLRSCRPFSEAVIFSIT